MRAHTIPLLVLCAGTGLFAMDGFSISNIQTFKSYKYGYTEGTLVRYDIKDNYVIDRDTLNTKGCSPSINQSGTFYAYLTSSGTAKKIVVRNIQGGQGYEIPVSSNAWWLWWAADGSFYYTDAPNGIQWYMRKVTLSKQGAAITVSDRKWAIFEYAVQGGFIDMSMVGDRVHVRGEGLRWPCTSKSDSGPYGVGGCENEKGSGASVMTGDTTKPLNRLFGWNGCGYGISPTGWFGQHWPGAHTTNAFEVWNAAEHSDPDITSASHDALNATWAVYRPSDPEANLEYLTQTGWVKCPIGYLGLDNGWSCNSDYWALSEITMAWVDGRPTNQIAINWKKRAAINVTKIMPPAANPTDGEGGQFRGITFTGGSRWAERGDLWCSTREDVAAQFLTYVENRAAENQKWADFFGIPAADISGSVATSPRLSRLRTPAGAAGVRIYDVRGRLAALSTGSVALPRAMGAGMYFVRQGDLRPSPCLVPE